MSIRLSIHLEQLVLTFKGSTEILPLSHVTYFYGQMGAGKSSIAKLIDYSLGGGLDLSPALQLEFVSASLHLIINGTQVSIERFRDSDQVHCSWKDITGSNDIVLPARMPVGIVIPETEVEVLSDFLFWLSGLKPPRVRKSRLKENSELGRLSIRDLLWYCYLDQDSFDSDFFHLGDDTNPFKKYKSRDVLRFILGFHQEEVSELESELQRLHLLKLELNGTAKSLQNALVQANVAGEKEILSAIDVLKIEAQSIQVQLESLRIERYDVPHGTELLKSKARDLAYEIEALQDAIPEVGRTIEQDTRHKNEILMLGIKVQRVAAARAVLAGVEFQACPRCAQSLPHRNEDDCRVCGQKEPESGVSNVSMDVVSQDAKSRISELEESINLHTEQLRRMQRRIEELDAARKKVDNEITRAMESYDSAYLSNALTLERRRAEIIQEISNLERLLIFPRKVAEILQQVDSTQAEESRVRRELEEARKGAESDLSNLIRLQDLFLDCLLKAKLPGITDEHIVSIRATDFLPIVYHPDTGEFAVTSFANLSSGGKKTLFKACFALAIHRLAIEVGAILPNLLIIDSPMKNISERENKLQFESFYNLVYDLATGELNQTQFILIDKEFHEPDALLGPEVQFRHMMPDSTDFPPLIPYLSL